MAETTADPLAALISETAARVESARAKINLALHVLDRRPDGYHLLDSLVVFAEVADTLTVVPEDVGFVRLTTDGPFAGDLVDATGADDNLVLTVADRLADAFPGRSGRGARLHLEKRLPVAAGLGGGSADAAAALRLLNRHWRLGLGAAELARLGLSLGADVPVCLASKPSRMEGIGGAVTPLAGLPPLNLVLVNPGIALATRAVFRRLEAESRTPMPAIPPRFASVMELVFWLRKTRNDLYVPAAAEAPPVERALMMLASDPDCVFARMSGSGPTAFGIFMSAEAANRAADRIHAARPQWWLAVTRTGGS